MLCYKTWREFYCLQTSNGHTSFPVQDVGSAETAEEVCLQGTV